MPTGYTADIATGEVSDFAEFAMQCSRAFGALVMMRDRPSGEKIPSRFEPSDFYEKKLAEAKKELNRLLLLSPEDAKKERDTLEEKRAADRAARGEAMAKQRARYEAMLAKVEKWTPPTNDHEGIKKFMRDQLTESIKFDCTPSTYMMEPLPSSGDWLDQEVDRVRQDIARYTTEHIKEVDRTESRNDWLRDLRESLST